VIRALADRPMAIVVLAAALQYTQTAWFDYAWDDKLAITANDYTKKGIAGLPEIFSQRVSVPFKSEYRPVPQALHAVEYELFGANPHAGHTFNVLWYAATCAAVFAFVRFVFRSLPASVAVAAALVFAVHPLHVEVVANIKSRDEILALLFGLLGLMALVTAVERARVGLGVLGVLGVVAACLSKSNAVTLLPLAPLALWYRAEGQAVSRRVIGLAAAAAIASGILAAAVRWSQSSIAAGLDLHLQSTVLNNVFLWTTQADAVIPTAIAIIGYYARLFLVPYPLVHLYGYDQVPLSTWGDAGPWLILGGLGLAAWGVWKGLRRKSPLAFGAIWAAVTYSVYSHFVFFAPDTMADRYLFMPSLGLAIVVAVAALRLAGVDPSRPAVQDWRARAVTGAGVAVLLVSFGYTLAASRDWRNDSTLIRNRIHHMPDNAAAQVIYGHTVNSEAPDGETPAARRQRKAAAMAAFMRALQIYPDFHGAWVAIGRLFAEQGTYDKAELAFLKAQRLETLNPDGYLNLGTLYLSLQDPALAAPYLEKAVLLDPRSEVAYVMLGRAYLQGNALDNLGAMTDTAQRWFPDSLELTALRATFHFRKAEYARAFELARGVVARDANNLLARAVLSSPQAQEAPR
jgi:protein O-mannosyl-transferase